MQDSEEDDDHEIFQLEDRLCSEGPIEQYMTMIPVTNQSTALKNRDLASANDCFIFLMDSMQVSWERQ